jgi:hypothetical protein
MVGIGVDLGATMVGMKMIISCTQLFYVSFYINFYVMVLTEFAGRERSSLPPTQSEVMGWFRRLHQKIVHQKAIWNDLVEYGCRCIVLVIV